MITWFNQPEAKKFKIKLEREIIDLTSKMINLSKGSETFERDYFSLQGQIVSFQEVIDTMENTDEAFLESIFSSAEKGEG